MLGTKINKENKKTAHRRCALRTRRAKGAHSAQGERDSSGTRRVRMKCGAADGANSPTRVGAERAREAARPNYWLKKINYLLKNFLYNTKNYANLIKISFIEPPNGLVAPK